MKRNRGLGICRVLRGSHCIEQHFTDVSHDTQSLVHEHVHPARRPFSRDSQCPERRVMCRCINMRPVRVDRDAMWRP